MTTYGDFFTGFGGSTIGAKAAGLDVLFGVEYDEKLAAVYRQNLGDHIRVADVTTIDISTLPRVDIFHASPPCTNASVANNGAGESPQDLAMAQAVVRYLAQHQPDVFTLENVWGYREFESWHVIARALLEIGYAYRFWKVNMANYGVPQTRKRMIVVARRDGVAIELPEQTHAKNPTPGLFGTKRRWVSWYEAIEDIYGLKEPYKPTERMLKKTGHVDNVLIDGQNTSSDSGKRLSAFSKNKPCFTATVEKRLVGYLIKDNGQYYKSTSRFVTRFQSFPDEYELPEKAGLAVKGIGNAVPPLFAQRLYESLVK